MTALVQAPARERPRPLGGPLVSFAQAERSLFGLTVVLAASLLWLAPRLPLVDLPQHAAQVALWRDLLRGTSPWAGLVHINLLTPYLVGYGLMLPLSFVMSLESAARVVLMAALLAQVGAGMMLRRSLGGDRRLDWLFLLGNFGFAWQWGMLTFVVACPVGLIFLWSALRHARRPRFESGAAMTAVGLLLLVSHGLVFLVFAAIGGTVMLFGLASQPARGRLACLIPYGLLAGACLAFRLLAERQPDAMHYDKVAYGLDIWLRPLATLVFTAGTTLEGQGSLLLLTALALLAPFSVLESRLNAGQGPAMAALLALVVLCLPSYAFQTAYLFERFSIFVVPFYALLFRAAAIPNVRRDIIGLAMLACAAWGSLTIQGSRLAAFARESADFEPVLAAAKPGQRALALVFEPASPAAHNALAYMHFASWYGADKQGLVDFNFASYHPQIVRFRPGMVPPVSDVLGRRPGTLDWAAADAGRYAYIFVRGTAEDAASVARKSPCGLDTVAASGRWTLLGRRGCGATSGPQGH